MGKAIIWDLDGTLLDSYHVIVESLYLVFKEYGIPMSREEIHQYAIASSSNALIAEVSEKRGLSPKDITSRYSQISGGKYLEIITMDHTYETLNALAAKNVQHFVYTHRGKTTIPTLKNLGLEAYFTEILTSQSGFARKPDPDAVIYLMKKYNLEPQSTYYAGDRNLDMECAKNAGIPGILYLPEKSKAVPAGAQTYIVKDLLDIVSIV